MRQKTTRLAELLRPTAQVERKQTEKPAKQKPATAWGRLCSGGLRLIVWLYFAALLAVWLLLHVCGDRWWLPTAMLFGPRWLCGLPLVALVPVAAVRQRRLLWPLGAAAIVVAGPIMGLCLPWSLLAPPRGPAIRLLTCNVKGKSVDNKVLEDLIRRTQPDIVALQGCWGEVRVQWPAGWHVWRGGEHVIASQYPLSPSETQHGAAGPIQRPLTSMVHCTVQTPWRETTLFSVHLLSPRQALGAVLDRNTLLQPSGGPKLALRIEQRSREAAEMAQWIGETSDSPVVVGDFNMAVQSAIYRQCLSKYGNAFSDAGLGWGYTEWPQIRGFTWGVRIDHILSGAGWRCRSCWVGPDVGSDHLPLIADLVWESDSEKNGR